MFLKKVENLLRLLHGRSISDIHDNDFDHLSLEMEEFEDADNLRKKYSEITDGIRKIYDRYFSDG